MALPANVDTGLVRGRFIVGVIDGPDLDDEPDAIPAQGTITFTASVPYLPNPSASTTILKAPIVAVLDNEGWLCVRLPDGTAGARGVRLIATDDEDLSVTGWTWNVTYAFENVNGVRPQIAAHSMALPTDATVDLTSVVKVPSSAGIGVEQAEALAASAQAAATEAAAAAALAADAAHPTDTGVAALVTYGGQTTAALDTQYRRDVSPAEFGAAGDGATDDTAAVRAAIQSGRPIHWGGPEKVYRITEPITANLTRPLTWRADGATLRGEFPTQVERMLTINGDGYGVAITGHLTIDATDTAHVCLRVWNLSEQPAPMTLTDVTTVNARRTTTAMAGCDGMQLAGTWSRIALTRATVRNVIIAAGVPVDATQGASGMSIYGINRGDGTARVPHVVQIDDVFIENVSAEDPDVEMNQNALRLFSGYSTVDQAGPMLTQYTVSGGTIRDVQGREVKCQAQRVTVDGLQIVRTKGGKGATHSIDFQMGGGTVRNVEAYYEDGNVPLSVVNFSGNSHGKTVPQRQVSGLKVATTGSEQIDRVVSVLSSDEPHTMTTVSDVSVHGTAPRAFVLMSGNPGAFQDLVATNLVGSPSEVCVQLAGGSSTAGGWDARVAVSSAINPGTVVPLVAQTTLARAETTASGVMGYTT